MRAFLLAALAAILFCVPGVEALAASLADSTTTVIVPWGDIVGAIMPAAKILFMGGLLWVAMRFAPPLYALMRTAQVEQLMSRAADFAFNAVPGAVKGREVTIDVGNEVLKEMLAYALAHGGEWLTQFAGTPAQIAEKAYARLNLPAEASKPDFEAVANEVTAKVGP